MAVATLFSVVFASCKKADSVPVWPQGPAGNGSPTTGVTAPWIINGSYYNSGATGATGAAGAAGATGATGATGLATASYVSIVHASPNAGNLDVALNGIRMNLTQFAYTYRVSYISFFTGKRDVAIYKSGSTTPIYSTYFDFSPGNFYSIFIIDTASRMRASYLVDNEYPATGDSVKLRFANMCPDVPYIDLYVKGSNQPIITNIPYMYSSSYSVLKSSNSIAFDIKASGQNTVLASSNTINLVTGNFYTVWSAGFSSMKTSDSKIRIETIRH